MKKVIAFLCVTVIVAACCWWFLGRSNGLVPVDQISSLVITHYDTMETTTATADNLDQLRHLANEINKLPLDATEISGMPPKYVLTFLDSNNHVLTEIKIYNTNRISNEQSAYRTELNNQCQVYTYINKLANGDSIPVQNPDLAILFLVCLGLLLYIPFCGGLCFVLQLAFCRTTDDTVLRCLPIAGTIIISYISTMNTNFFSFLFYLFASLLHLPIWFSIYGILLPVCMFCHYLGWRQGDSARKSKVGS